jgi:type I restriction enzyme S subunit
VTPQHLPVGWRNVRAEEIAAQEKGSIVSGPFGSNIGKRFFVDEGVPVIRGNNLKAGDSGFVDGGFVFITEEKAHELRNCAARPDDLIFTAAGTLGQVGLIPKHPRFPFYIISNKQLRLRCNRAIAVPAYLYYWFAAPRMRHYISNQNTGSSVPLITLGTLRNLPVVLPPVGVQDRIASILSAYDDLIENNTRRIKILEDMAQMIYREWFVNFHFPGHENVRLVESELGPIPEGWTAKAVTEAVAVNPPVKVPKEGIKPFVPMGCLSENSMLINDIEEREGNSGSKFQNEDTLFARITPCLENGKTGFVQFLSAVNSVAFGSTEFIVLRSQSLCPEYVYLMARSSEFRDNAIKSMSGATGRQRVQEKCFDKFMLAQPDAETLLRFRRIVGPVFTLIYALSQKNKNLRTTRDLLLPKLISGEIPVEASEEALVA